LSAQETSSSKPPLATSDSSLFHNILVSPSTGGFDTRMAGSTPPILPQTVNSDQGGFWSSVGSAINSVGNSPVFQGLVRTGEGTLAFVGGGVEALPGVTLVITGFGACTTGAGCVAGIPLIALGVGVAAPGFITSTAGVTEIMSGLGQVVSGITGQQNPFDIDPISFILDLPEGLR